MGPGLSLRGSSAGGSLHTKNHIRSITSGAYLTSNAQEQGVGQKDILEPFEKVKLSDLVVFTRQFTTMINAGLSIVRCLYVLSEQTDNKKPKDVLDDLRKQVAAGLALSEALE
jgi:type IV pilus assembly protein PilC